MTAPTRSLHETWIRLLRQGIKAWEVWARAQPNELSPSFKILHEALTRLFKGCIRAWETWLRSQHVEDDLNKSQKG